MSQSEKSAYYAALKESGVSFDKHYRDYTTVELKKMYAEKAPADAPEPVVQPREAPKLPHSSLVPPSRMSRCRSLQSRSATNP